MVIVIILLYVCHFVGNLLYFPLVLVRLIPLVIDAEVPCSVSGAYGFVFELVIILRQESIRTHLAPDGVLL